MPKSVYFTGVIFEGIHGHQKVEQPLGEGLNIIYGENGSGKTTFLHVLANFLERDIERFCHIKFDSIQVITSEGSEIRLRQGGNAGTRFVEISIDNRTIGRVERDHSPSEDLDSALKNRLSGRPVYLPAFRSILEAAPSTRRPFKSVEREEHEKEFQRIIMRESRIESESLAVKLRVGLHASDRRETTAQKTVLCRRWFGDFVPVIRYPSLGDIQAELISELEEAHFNIHRTDQRILSSVFVNVIQSIVSDKDGGPTHEEKKEISESSVRNSLKQVQEYLNTLNPVQPTESDIYTELSRLFEKTTSEVKASELSLFSRVLHVYIQALSERTQVQKQAYKNIKLFQESVNQFLKGKSLTLNFGPMTTPRDLGPLIKLANGEFAKLGVLSSGERHVLSLLFSATHMRSTDGIVLIDEPELSLHVDWQRIILSELTKQVGDRQVIACTHSPEVAAEHLTRLRELSPRSWQRQPNTGERPEVSDELTAVDDESDI